MKILGIIGTSLGIIAAISGAYLQFSLIPAAITADRNIDRAIDSYGSMYFGSPQHHLDIAAMSAKTDFAIVVMGIGLLSFFTKYCSCYQETKTRMDWRRNRYCYLLPGSSPWNTYV